MTVPIESVERMCCVAMMDLCEEVAVMLTTLGDLIEEHVGGQEGLKFNNTATSMRELLQIIKANLAMADEPRPNDGDTNPSTPTERTVFLRGLRTMFDDEPDLQQFLLTRGQIRAMLSTIDDLTYE